jgi:hypothetical protein
MVLPKQAEGARKLLRGLPDFVGERGGADPAAFGDFGGVEGEGTGEGPKEKDLDEFVAGLGRGAELEDGAEGQARVVPAEFLGEFAAGGGGVVLARVEMAAAGGVPAIGEGVLGRAALLEEEATGIVVDEDVDGAVEKAAGVNFPARGLADDLVAVVHHVEDLVTALGHGREKRRSVGHAGRPASAIIGASGRAQLEDFDFDGDDAGPFHLQDVRGGGGDVEDASAGPRSAIVDADLDAESVIFVGDADDASEGKVAVCSRKVVFVETFAAGGVVALLGAVPGSLAVQDFTVMRPPGSEGVDRNDEAEKDEEEEGNEEQTRPRHEQICRGVDEEQVEVMRVAFCRMSLRFCRRNEGFKLNGYPKWLNYERIK